MPSDSASNRDHDFVGHAASVPVHTACWRRPNAQGFDTFSFVTSGGRVISGFVVSESADQVHIRQENGLVKPLKKADIEERIKQERSLTPEGLAGSLTPEQLADLLAYLQSL